MKEPQRHKTHGPDGAEIKPHGPKERTNPTLAIQRQVTGKLDTPKKQPSALQPDDAVD